MTTLPIRPVGYLLKRFPRLSETFILNEMLALERLGVRLNVFSLMRPEEAMVHRAIEALRAQVTYFPEDWAAKFAAVAKAHASMAIAEPLRYLRALGLALWWCVRARKPLGVCKQFLRAGFVALHCRRQAIVHLHAHFANAPTMVAHLVGVMCDIPHSFTTHAKDLYLTRPAVLRARVRRASFVLTCTRYNVAYLRSVLPPHEWDKVHLVYHGIDLAAFPFGSPKTAADSRRTAGAGAIPLVLSVGRLVPKKGLKDLIAACQLLHQRDVRFRCVIVGEGPLRREIEDQIESLGLKGVVSLLGAMAHEDLIPIYREASVFALVPQITADGDRDGIPNVLAEAMASGVPVVSSSVSGIPELVEHGRTGLLVGPGDPAALARAVEDLLTNSALSKRLAAAARRKMEDHFECWETARSVRTLLPQLQT